MAVSESDRRKGATWGRLSNIAGLMTRQKGAWLGKDDGKTETCNERSCGNRGRELIGGLTESPFCETEYASSGTALTG